MKFLTIIAVLFLFSSSAFCQLPKDTVKKVDPPTVTIVVNSYYDTMKLNLIYFTGGDELKVKAGFAVRLIETNSAHADQNRIKGIAYYDEKWKLFTKQVIQVFPR